MEGRDIGTVVFPHADLKFYIDASPEERARRRAADPAHTGGQASLANVQSDLVARDKSDSTRIGRAARDGEGRGLHRHHVDADRGRRQSRDDAGDGETAKIALQAVAHMTPEEFRKAGHRVDRLDRGLPRRRRVAPGDGEDRARRDQGDAAGIAAATARILRRDPRRPRSHRHARASPRGSIRGSSATSRRTRCWRACSAITSAPASASSAWRGSRARR